MDWASELSDSAYWFQKIRSLLANKRHLADCVQASNTFYGYHQAQLALWEKVMAKAKEPTKKADFVGFANLEIPSELKEDCKKWLETSDAIHDAIEVLALDGCKITITQNEGNNAFQATAFCWYPKSPNAGYILSAFASNWFDALAVLAWKHVVLAQRGKWYTEKSKQPIDMFG